MFDLKSGGCVHVASWLAGDEELKTPDRVVQPLPAERSAMTVRVWYDYPLRNAHFRETTVDQDLTEKMLTDLVCADYAKIYAEERASMTGEESRVPGMLNRAPSDGKHGVWGHVLTDLFLETADLGEDGTWTLGVGS